MTNWWMSISKTRLKERKRRYPSRPRICALRRREGGTTRARGSTGHTILDGGLRRLPARIYGCDSEREPVRESLRCLRLTDRMRFGEDNRNIEFPWPMGCRVSVVLLMGTSGGRRRARARTWNDWRDNGYICGWRFLRRKGSCIFRREAGGPLARYSVPGPLQWLSAAE